MPVAMVYFAQPFNLFGKTIIFVVPFYSLFFSTLCARSNFQRSACQPRGKILVSGSHHSAVYEFIHLSSQHLEEGVRGSRASMP